jgi:hypothetical protein
VLIFAAADFKPAKYSGLKDLSGVTDLTVFAMSCSVCTFPASEGRAFVSNEVLVASVVSKTGAACPRPPHWPPPLTCLVELRCPCAFGAADRLHANPEPRLVTSDDLAAGLRFSAPSRRAARP